jgi:uncharacterized protein (TIGR03435 family)
MMAFGSPADKAAFEVASIRVAEPGRENIQAVPGSLTMKSVRMITCIRWAYDVLEYQVSGPAWMNEVRFDVTAKAATPAKEAEMRLMMQALLAERFKLTVHHQVKELTALVLTVGKNGHKLTPVETEGNPSFSTGKLTLTGKGATLAQMIQFLSREIRNPIVDQTGLTGRFDYAVDISTYVTEEILKGAGPGGPPPEAPSIIAQALQSQLGLKLDPKKVPMDTVVVDSVEKTPTEN